MPQSGRPRPPAAAGVPVPFRPGILVSPYPPFCTAGPLFESCATWTTTPGFALGDRTGDLLRSVNSFCAFSPSFRSCSSLAETRLKTSRQNANPCTSPRAWWRTSVWAELPRGCLTGACAPSPTDGGAGIALITSANPTGILSSYVAGVVQSRPTCPPALCPLPKQRLSGRGGRNSGIKLLAPI